MLRTGQSLLANAILQLHLGRGTSRPTSQLILEWRIPASKPQYDPENPSSVSEVEAYATYARILSYFMDDPSPLCPFSVHRMALIGKELGKEVGEWFGPSTASGALKTLADAFPPCGVSVATSADGTIYKSEVYTASRLPNGEWPSTSDKPSTERWGHKAVLILVGLRLGLDGVNPIYHDSIKVSLFGYSS
jgi:cysteine protease ATG4